MAHSLNSASIPQNNPCSSSLYNPLHNPALMGAAGNRVPLRVPKHCPLSQPASNLNGSANAGGCPMTPCQLARCQPQQLCTLTVTVGALMNILGTGRPPSLGDQILRRYHMHTCLRIPACHGDKKDLHFLCTEIGARPMTSCESNMPRGRSIF